MEFNFMLEFVTDSAVSGFYLGL